MSDANGKPIEESKEPMVYLHGGYGNTLPKIEAALEGQLPGYQVTLQLPPQDAFGLRDESLLRSLPKTQFPPGVKVGGQLEGHGDDGQVQVFNVMKIKGDTVLLDGTRQTDRSLDQPAAQQSQTNKPKLNKNLSQSR